MPGTKLYLIAVVGETGSVEDFLTPNGAWNRSEEQFLVLANKMCETLTKQKKTVEAKQLSFLLEGWDK